MALLLFSTTDHLFSRSIRFLTRSKYSHVEAVTKTGMLLGADATYGVCYTSLKERLEESKKILLCSAFMPPNREKVYFQFLFDQIEKKYDWTALAGFLFRRKWQEENKWFCSEIIQAASIQADSPFLNMYDTKSHRISPRDLLLSNKIAPISSNPEEIKKQVIRYSNNQK